MTLRYSREEGIFMKRSIAFGFVLVFVYASLGGFAQSPATPGAKTAAAIPGVESYASTPDAAITRHTVKVGGKILNYTATAGMMPMRDGNGKLQAEMFYIAYTLDGVTDRSKRPLLISFNGGPGSSSVWMHLGFLGPRKVVYDEEGFQLQPPYKLEDNEYSILDEADIVFIDPIATGYSRMTPGEDLHKFHGLMEDLESVGEFIRLYVTRNSRWESPKFLIGESYGTTRAAGLTGYLLNDENSMYLNGTILVSSMTLGVSTGADIDAILILPHYTATAWYHKKLPPDLQAKPLRQVLDEAEKFAQGDYLGALVRGNDLVGKELDEIAARISRYSGVSANYVKQNNLRIGRSQFRKELLRDKGLTVGRLDSRYAGIDRSPNGESPEYDPAMAAWSGPFTGAVNSYFKNELKYATDRSYNIFGDVGAWRGMSSGAGMMGGRPSGVGEMLRQAMAQNPFQRVLVLAGYYDAGCDYFSAEYAFSHLDPAGTFKDRVAFRYYECGHMMYIRKADLAKAKADLAEFIRSALPKS
jgi:carboxypeptidase C (cathepsin A)